MSPTEFFEKHELLTKEGKDMLLNKINKTPKKKEEEKEMKFTEAIQLLLNNKKTLQFVNKTNDKITRIAPCLIHLLEEEPPKFRYSDLITFCVAEKYDINADKVKVLKTYNRIKELAEEAIDLLS